MEAMRNVKVEIVKRGRRIKDLAEAYPMMYTQMSRILNGFDRTPEGFKRRVKEVLAAWDEE